MHWWFFHRHTLYQRTLGWWDLTLLVVQVGSNISQTLPAWACCLLVLQHQSHQLLYLHLEKRKWDIFKLGVCLQRFSHNINSVAFTNTKSVIRLFERHSCRAANHNWQLRTGNSAGQLAVKWLQSLNTQGHTQLASVWWQGTAGGTVPQTHNCERLKAKFGNWT